VKLIQLAIALFMAFIFTACSTLQPHAATPTAVSGGVFTSLNGMTLYVYDNDVASSGKSVCNGPCAVNWPPLLAVDNAVASDDYTLISRDDGKKQWAYKGKPLHFWIKDQKPGDMTGDGFKNLWHVAKP
jgi:predicted lipoprotein with Yx(FWY)xxD motif